MRKHLFEKVIFGTALAFILLGLTKEKASFGETITGSVGVAGLSEGIEDYYEEDNNISFLITIKNNFPENIAIVDSEKVGSYLYIRSGAGTSNSKVGLIYPNAALIVKSDDFIIVKKNGKEEKWLKVKSGEAEGYSSAEYLILGDEATSKSEELKTLCATVNNKVAALNVRTQPSVNADIITQVKAGEQMEVAKALVVNKEDGDNKLWVQVYLTDDSDGNNTGYVSLDYVSLNYELQWGIKYCQYGTNVSDVRIAICDEAMKFLGTKYVWGGNDPKKGIDCSGLVNYVFKTVYNNNKSFQKYLGVATSMPRVSADMQKKYKSKGKEITSVLKSGKVPSYLKPGDLIFYANKTKVFHVAIYIGNGKIVHSSTNTKGIGVSDIDFILPAHVYYANIITD